MNKIKIRIGLIEATAELNRSSTAEALFNALPMRGHANIWGSEIYFGIPINKDLEEDYAKNIVNFGDIAYWPSGNSFCIFFGPTPASKGKEIRPASAVTVIGRITNNPKVFDVVREREIAVIERV
ncbi:MAG: cyclophilin-like fold protein [Candidatus Micrarchaeota archaeon]